MVCHERCSGYVNVNVNVNVNVKKFIILYYIKKNRIMIFFNVKPFYSFNFLFNKDIHQLFFVIILIWKLYYYFTEDNIRAWDVANSAYKTTNYIFKIINNLFDAILFIYFIILIVNNK
jgi:hypothetical protein